jgi:hypothetical protein
VTTPPLLRVVRRTLDTLEKARVRFAVLGGFAVRVWGIPRPTYDLDVAVGIEAKGLRALLSSLEEAGFVVPAEHTLGFLDRVGGMQKLSVSSLEEGHLWEVDLFLASTPFLRSALRKAVAADLDGRRVPVCTPEDVILLKLLAGRRKDLVDVQEVLLVAGRLDRARMRRWAERLGVRRALERALAESGSG